jgi:glyceraldehyde 3-phosphate dehydrogenase
MLNKIIRKKGSTRKIAINGFGRIGRSAFKQALNKKGVEVVAINDLASPQMLAHLLQYDSAYGKYEGKVSATKSGIKVDGKVYPVFSQKDPANLPWQEHGVDTVLECTGFFTTTELAQGHIDAGARRVVISAPAKDDITPTLVYGTTDTGKKLNGGSSKQVVSMASCTTNCISPAIQVLESAFGVDKALMTTIHSYTSSQNLVDGPHKDMRRARAAAANIVPTSTGAALATTKVVPKLKGKFDGIALRVPTISGSLSDMTVLLKKKQVTVADVNNAFKKAAKNPLFKGVLAVTDVPLVSSDYIGNSYSSIIDMEFTKVVGGNLVKVLSWYDNELGYATRLVEMSMSV